jgi:hypothetical protein
MFLHLFHNIVCFSLFQNTVCFCLFQNTVCFCLFQNTVCVYLFRTLNVSTSLSEHCLCRYINISEHRTYVSIFSEHWHYLFQNTVSGFVWIYLPFSICCLLQNTGFICLFLLCCLFLSISDHCLFLYISFRPLALSIFFQSFVRFCLFQNNVCFYLFPICCLCSSFHNRQ